MQTTLARRTIPIAAIAAGAILLLTPIVGADDDDGDALDTLATWMTGSFSSAAQAAEDPEFFDISLHMAQIWSDRTDGRWLYVEQAVAEHQDRPYRQRVYRLRELVPGLFESRVYTLPDPTAVIGAWREEAPLAELEPSALEERDGCEILLRIRGETFAGSTLASLCSSGLRGASYATSEVLVTPDGLISWDRGFAADGSQVWGATTGGYVFDRIVDDPASASGIEIEGEPDSDSGSDSDGEVKLEGGETPPE